jgi:tetratricopeptide (TPR) repeat protein
MSRQLDQAVEAAYAAFEAGDVIAAEDGCARVLGKSPRDVRALHLLGTIRLRSGDARGASALLEKAAKLRPSDDRLLEDLAHAQLGAGDAAAAERSLRRALKLTVHPRASLQVAIAYATAALARHGEAEEALRAALRIEPGNARLTIELGKFLAGRGRTSDARECFERAAAAEPGMPEAAFNVAVMLEREGRYAEAANAYRALIERSPEDHDAYLNFGVVYEHLGRDDEALRCYERALAIDPQSVAAYVNLGKALRTAGRIEEAGAACLQALRVDPACADALVNLAGVLADLGEPEEALLQYDKALTIDPDAHDARLSRAMLALALGRYEQGFRDYAWRPTRIRARSVGVSVDDALPAVLDGTHVRVLGEQGLGDEIFFLRYAAALRARGAHVHVECDSRLASLVERTGIFESVSLPGESHPGADRTYIAGDLPLIFIEAGLSPLVQPLPLGALPLRVGRLRERLATFSGAPYIGLTWWAGTPPAVQRGRVDRALYKSLPMEVIASALRPLRGTFIALQRQPGPGEIERLSSLLGREVHDFSAANEDLEEMLALLSLLHEYIGVSSTNMHLAAGLGSRARVVVPNPPEWRWMWRGAQSPWFPGFTLYRQAPDRDWNDALSALATDLLGSHRRE